MPTPPARSSDVDRRRSAYIERMLVDAGIAPPLAATRAQLLYWAYLGAALSRSRLTGERLERAVAELERLALGGSAAKTAAVADRPRRRSGRG